MLRTAVQGPPGELEMPVAREVAVVQGEDLDLSEDAPLMAPDTLQATEEGRATLPANTRRPSALTVFVLVVSVGGFLFGFDTGVISGALPYIRDDLLQAYSADPAALARWQELIVSAAIVAAGAGSVAGGWLADRVGRKRALLTADVLFTAGAVAMAAARDQWWLIAGRALVGLGVGLASVTVPIYIAECAPPARRASLVTVNVLFITTGQFVAYVADYVFTFVPGTWRWMLGVAAVPSLVQLCGLLLLPESPRWLASKGREAEAHRALQKLQPGASPALSGLGSFTPASAARGDISGGGAGAGGGTSTPGASTPWRLLLTRPVLRQLHVGVGLQVLQQVAGINTVMYYAPSILELAGVPKQAALLLSMVPSATNALGTVVGLRLIDKHGRRRLLLTSTAAVVLSLAALGCAFMAAERHSPAVQPGGAGACPAGAAAAGALPDCTACLHAGCGFCGAAGEGGGDVMQPGTCLSLEAQQAQQQQQWQPAGEGREGVAMLGGIAGAGAATCAPPHHLFVQGCPSRYSWLILGCLVAYLAAFSPGLGPVPWAVNAEIYPLAVRGVATGIAATANWLTNAAVAQTFLTLTRLLGASGTFYLYSLIACVGFCWTFLVLPETNGLTLEQVQQLFSGDRPPSGGGGGGGGGGRAASAGGSAGWRWGGPDRKHRASDDEGEETPGSLAGSARQ